MKQNLSSPDKEIYAQDAYALRCLKTFVENEKGNATVPFVVLIALSLSIFFATMGSMNSSTRAMLFGTTSSITVFGAASRVTLMDNGEPIDRSAIYITR